MTISGWFSRSPPDASGQIHSLSTLTSGGSPVIGAKGVMLRFTPTTDVPPSQVVLVESGQGRYTGQGTYLSLPDRWEVQVAVRREGRYDSFADLLVDLRPAEAALNLAWPRLTGGFLGLAGLLAWAAIRRSQVGLPAQVFRALPAAGALHRRSGRPGTATPGRKSHQSGPAFLRLRRSR